MFLPMVGSIYNSLKTTELNMKWEQRKKDPKWDTMDERSREIARLQDTAADVRKSNLLSAIDGKLQAGAVLSDQELAYLRKTNPQLYQEAMQIAQERRAYEKELENCETKDEVERTKAAKMQQMLSQAKTVSSNPNIPEGEKYKQLMKISRRTMGLCKEHNKFINSLQYARLPREIDLEREEKERRKEEAGECGGDTEKTEMFLSDEEMQKKLDDLKNGAADGEQAPEAGLQEGQEPPKTETQEKGGPQSAGGAVGIGVPRSPVSSEPRLYDARGSVKAAPAPAKGLLDVKR